MTQLETPHNYSFQKHVLTLGSAPALSHSPWSFKIGRRSEPSSPKLCGLAKWFHGLTCFVALITLLKIKQKPILDREQPNSEL